MNAAPYKPRQDIRPSQGAIYRDIEVSVAVGGPDIDLQRWTFPYSAVMTQECDLLQDDSARQAEPKSDSARDDKLLLAVLLCPAYKAAAFRNGEHLQFLGRRMQRHSSNSWRRIKSNQNARYHYLSEWRELQVAELVVDFKHFFTLPIEVLRDAFGNDKHYIARLSSLYREDLSQRFASYLARIGLPVQHHQLNSAPRPTEPRPSPR